MNWKSGYIDENGETHYAAQESKTRRSAVNFARILVANTDNTPVIASEAGVEKLKKYKSQLPVQMVWSKEERKWV